MVAQTGLMTTGEPSRSQVTCPSVGTLDELGSPGCPPRQVPFWLSGVFMVCWMKDARSKKEAPRASQSCELWGLRTSVAMEPVCQHPLSKPPWLLHSSSEHLLSNCYVPGSVWMPDRAMNKNDALQERTREWGTGNNRQTQKELV